ncbi:MAG TPA: hypothetical protein VFG08_10950 [Candidatus Polarisedimenticolia bacterium]|nr:hypothetical protein [Candidatus Polarisedimenticolia bacterium]
MKPTRAGTFLVFGIASILGFSPVLRAEEIAGAFSRPDEALLEKVFGEFSTVGLDLDKPLQVSDLVLRKDSLELRFTSGVMHLAQPIEGEVTGAFFEGEGAMTLILPNAMEKKALKREYGADSVSEAFTQVVMRFDDKTALELREMARPATTAVQDPASTWAGRNKILYSSDTLPIGYLESRVNGISYRSSSPTSIRRRQAG